MRRGWEAQRDAAVQSSRLGEASESYPKCHARPLASFPFCKGRVGEAAGWDCSFCHLTLDAHSGAEWKKGGRDGIHRTCRKLPGTQGEVLMA